MTVPQFLEARRSVRSFSDEPVSPAILETLIEAACVAPAPHHSRPWRWVAITQPEAKAALAEAMGNQWRIDLLDDGLNADRVEQLVASSHRKINSAPAIILGCLTWNGLDSYPDPARQHAEFGMALLSLGAAVENLMLCAAHLDYASCWVAAPIFCPDAARDGLALPSDWRPHAMVFVGKADPRYVGRPRPPIPMNELARFYV